MKNFKETWRIINIDRAPHDEAFLNLKLESDISKNYEEIYAEIKKLNIKFDAVICLVNDEVQSFKITEKEIFNEIETLVNNNFMIQLLGAKLATNFIQHNGIFLLNGKVQYFEGATTDQIAKNLIYNQVNFLGINLTHRKDDSIPIDATITTYLENDDLSTVSDKEKIASFIKKWSDGYDRPHDGSYIVLRKKDNIIYPEYL